MAYPPGCYDSVSEARRGLYCLILMNSLKGHNRTRRQRYLFAGEIQSRLTCRSRESTDWRCLTNVSFFSIRATLKQLRLNCCLVQLLLRWSAFRFVQSQFIMCLYRKQFSDIESSVHSNQSSFLFWIKSLIFKARKDPCVRGFSGIQCSAPPSTATFNHSALFCET